VHDHEVIRLVTKGQGLKIPDDMDIAETTGLRDGGTGGGGCWFVAYDEIGPPGHPCFGTDQGCDGRFVETHLKRAFAKTDATHRDRQRLAANARFPQKPSHFPHDIVADCDSTN